MTALSQFLIIAVPLNNLMAAAKGSVDGAFVDGTAAFVDGTAASVNGTTASVNGTTTLRLE